MFRWLLTAAFSTALSGCATLEGSANAPTADARRPRAEQLAPPPPAPSTTSQPGPAPPAFIEERARQAYETGRWDVAEGYYLQLTRLKPGDAEPWFQLGNLYAEQGRLDSAQRAYRESLRRRDDARTLHNLGLVQVKLGIGALRESQKRLPPNDPARQETRELLRTLLETALP
jgi:tetratricopeptide (TPR) repeat protein